MSANNKTYQPVQSLTVKSVEALPAFRFVSHLGSLCDDGKRALGVTEVDWMLDEYAQVVSLGTIAVETTTTIDIGDNVTSAADGKARKAETSDEINGRALETVNGAGFTRIKLVP